MGDILKLAVTALCGSQQDVVDRVNDLAAEIEDGGFGDVKTVVAVIETKDGKLTHHTIGEPCDLARAVGLLTIESVRSAVGNNR